MKLDRELDAIRAAIKAEIEKAESIIDSLDNLDNLRPIREARQAGKITAYKHALKLLNE